MAGRVPANAKANPVAVSFAACCFIARKSPLGHPSMTYLNPQL
nr:MAG TPA: hypothetical protein [Caudoviricetes sp.]